MSAERTPLYERHVALGAKIVDFAGWEMPIQYPTGIVEEHLKTRRAAGLFDVSHMGRFFIRGKAAAAFLDAALCNDVGTLEPLKAQYTLIPTESGGALDDAYLYRLGAEEYLLVVNAGNRERDWARLQEAAKRFPGLDLRDRSRELAMISLQGPRTVEVVEAASGAPLDAAARRSPRNTVWQLGIGGLTMIAVRTGYAGEPQGFELMVPVASAAAMWDRLLDAGAVPVGLGARDTLRLEAGLPLYGHELGTDAEGREIPAFACPQARGAVKLSPHKSGLRGATSFAAQAAAWARIKAGDLRDVSALPRLVRALTLLEPGVARGGARILAASGRHIGWVTSGTVVPIWVFDGSGITDRSDRRPALLGLLDSAAGVGETVTVEVRGRLLSARVVRSFVDANRPPYLRPILPQ